MKVITVTLNPAIDMTVSLLRPLTRGSVNRASSLSETAGGKGINVASFLSDWGLPISVTGLIGQENVGVFENLFRRKGLRDYFIRRPGRTRLNLKVLDSGETTDLNLPGLAADGEALEALEKALLTLVRLSRKPCTVVLAGSLPQGTPADFYARLTEKLEAEDCLVLLDTSGAALRASLEAPVLPHYLKPNRQELEECLEKPLKTEKDWAEAARGLLDKGLRMLILSLGSEGAAFFDPNGAFHARLPVKNLRSTVGAGDAMVAGAVAALDQGGDLERVARLGTAFASARVDADFEGSPRNRSAIEAFAASAELRPLDF